MENEKQTKHELKEKPMSFMTLVILTGFIGGLVLGALAYLAYIFDFTAISPKVILEPWAIGDWKNGWLGTVISIILIGGISILVALIYYALLRKFNNIWAGIVYGLVLFLLVFFILNPIFPGIPPFHKLKVNTLVTTLCLYVLYGLFIGYSISYEEAEIQSKKEKQRKDEAESPAT